MGWTIFHDKMRGRYKAVNRINGRLKSIYIGKDPSIAEKKIQEWLDRESVKEKPEMCKPALRAEGACMPERSLWDLIEAERTAKRGADGPSRGASRMRPEKTITRSRSRATG